MGQAVHYVANQELTAEHLKKNKQLPLLLSSKREINNKPETIFILLMNEC